MPSSGRQKELQWDGADGRPPVTVVRQDAGHRAQRPGRRQESELRKQTEAWLESGTGFGG